MFKVDFIADEPSVRLIPNQEILRSPEKLSRGPGMKFDILLWPEGRGFLRQRRLGYRRLLRWVPLTAALLPAEDNEEALLLGCPPIALTTQEMIAQKSSGSPRPKSPGLDAAKNGHPNPVVGR